MTWPAERRAQLVALALAGESWQAIGAQFWPANAPRAAGMAAASRFHHYATPQERAQRRAALAASGRLGRPAGAETASEDKDIFAGMGECFA